jgi:FKBP-type peptidyl-prolyl cis-trans isomerase
VATPRSQRIGIWVIAIVLAIGTLGSFLVIILSNQNQKVDSARIQELTTKYQSDLNKQAKQLSEKYYPSFKQYANIPAKFDASNVTKLETNDLHVGDGAEIKKGTAYSAYYIGWNPKGVVFDQSIEKDALKNPIIGGGLIDGWEEGVVGMKMGGVREISIPSDKAYGKTGSGDNIPPNTPIKFVVMVIPKVDEIAVPQELINYYQSQSTTTQ